MTVTARSKVRWFKEPPEASLAWLETPISGVLGTLKFVDPEGTSAMVYVTTGIAYRHHSDKYHVWHVEVDEIGMMATVSPSIEHKGHFHTPNPVVFKLTSLEIR